MKTETGSDFPKEREALFVGGAFEVVNAARSTRSGFESDDAGDDTDVMFAPEGDLGVEVDHGFGEEIERHLIERIAVDVQEDAEDTFFVFGMFGKMFEVGVCGDIHSKVAEHGVIDLAQIGFLETAFEARLEIGAVVKEAEIGGVFESRKEFKFTELDGLKAACGFEVIAEAQEVDGAHGFEDMDLLDKDAHDLNAAIEEVAGLKDMQLAHLFGAIGEFLEDELEPKLVGLVDDDKQHLVVFGRIGLGELKLQKFWDF